MGGAVTLPQNRYLTYIPHKKWKKEENNQPRFVVDMGMQCLFV